MKILYSANTYLLLLISLLLISCGSEEKEPEKPQVQNLKIGQLEVVANYASHGLVQPYAINVMNNGNLVVIDANLKEVFVIKPTGELITKFGQEGKGPGEFVMPLDIQFVGNTINIIDVNQYKVLKFDYDGVFDDSYTYKTKAVTRKIVLLDDQIYISNAEGFNNNLLAVTYLAADSTRYFGEAKRGAIEIVDLQKEIKDFSNGKIPSVFENATTLAHENGFIYVFMDSYSELRKYSLSGELIWDKPVELPYNEEVFNSTVKAVKSMQGRLIAINYIYDLNVLGGEVYLLTKKVEGKPQLIVKIDANGNIDTMYTMPESEAIFTAFSFDKSREQIYLTSTDGEILKTTFKF